MTDHPPASLPARSRFLIGIPLLIVANIGFSAKAVIVKLLYRHGVGPEGVLVLRMLLALPFYLGMALYLVRRPGNVRLSARQWLVISALGILSHYVSSMLDFLGLQYVTAAVERLVLYTYPTIVLVLLALFFKKSIRRGQWLALLVTYAGIFVTFAAEHGLGDQRDVVRGGLLVFGCAVTYSIYLLFTGEYVRRVGSAKFTSYAMLAATVPAVVQSWWTDGLAIFHYPPEAYHLAVWLALVATVLPTFLISEGLRLVGAGNAGIIGFVGPVATIFLGWWFLGEPVSAVQLFGTVIVLLGIFFLVQMPDKTF